MNDLIIIDNITIILTSKLNSLLNIPNWDKYLFDYYLMSK